MTKSIIKCVSFHEPYIPNVKHVTIYSTYPANDTLPKDCLIPDFSGNADYVATDNLFAARESRREMWIRSFPRLERPSDELVNTMFSYHVCISGVD